MPDITPEELQLGDVLLYRKTGLISRLICLFDGSEYSHASVYDGKQVVEAVSHGVMGNTPADSAAHAEFVDVYRFISDDLKPLGSAKYPAEPVAERIQYYLDEGDRYGYEQLLLLALLTTTRRIPGISSIPWLRSMVRTVLD